MCQYEKKKPLLNQRHLPPEAQPVALLRGEDNTADDRRTHREHIYPGAGPDNCIPMDLLQGKKKKTKTCRAYFTRKYSELDVAHFLFYSLSFFFSFFSGFHVSSPSIKPHFHAFAEHVGHGGQDGSKIKTGKGLWIHLILICIV